MRADAGMGEEGPLHDVISVEFVRESGGGRRWESRGRPADWRGQTVGASAVNPPLPLHMAPRPSVARDGPAGRIRSSNSPVLPAPLAPGTSVQRESPPPAIRVCI